jgi:hypothetical protein
MPWRRRASRGLQPNRRSISCWAISAPPSAIGVGVAAAGEVLKGTGLEDGVHLAGEQVEAGRIALPAGGQTHFAVAGLHGG